MRQFSLKNLFLGTLVAAMLLAFVASEPIGVAMAAVFCVASWLGILALSFLSIRHLVDTIIDSVQSKRIGGLTARYRWAYLDAFIATWMFFTIVISNFVLENSVANARYLIWCGWIVWSIGLAAVIGQVIWQRRTRAVGGD